MIEARVDVLLFVAWAAGGATLAWLAAARARTAAMVTLVALGGCVGLAALLGDARMSPVAGTLLEQDPYLRWWLTAASASLLAVHLVSVVSGGAWRGGPAMLLALAATGMALALHDRIAGLLIIGAASLVATERPRSIEGSPIRVPVIARATILATVLGIAAAGLATTIITPGHQLFFDTGAVNASLLLAAAALAVRAGGAPVADPVRSGSGLAPRPSSAVASGWLPAGTLLVLVASATTGFVRTGGDLERTAVTTELIGIGALLVAAAVALVARDAGRILGAIVVSNGSLVIFVLVPGANSPTADDARAAAGWLPWLAITASWVVGWLVVAAAGRASLRIPASRGWTRRRPLLALALLVGAALACGWPGLPSGRHAWRSWSGCRCRRCAPRRSLCRWCRCSAWCACSSPACATHPAPRRSAAARRSAPAIFPWSCGDRGSRRWRSAGPLSRRCSSSCSRSLRH